MIVHYLIPGGILILLLLFQLVIAPLLAINQVTPDTLVIFSVYFALRWGAIHGMVAGSITGFLFDLVSGLPLGSSMFAKTLSAYVSGLFYNENKVGQNIFTWRFALIIFAASLINYFALYIITGFDFSANILDVITIDAVYPALYTMTLSFVVVFFFPKRNLD